MNQVRSQPASPPPSPPRSSGVVLPNRPTASQRVAAAFVTAAIRTINFTLRYQLHDPGGHLRNGGSEPVIFAIWHNRLALSPVAYYRLVRQYQDRRRMAVMVSASRDGAFLARIMESFEIEAVRGSTSRRGPQALRELVRWAQRGYDLAITPDGPRGPRYVVQEGIIALGQLTGLPIVPAGYRLTRKLQASSWDRFLIPLPFGRWDMHIAEPLRIPRQTDAAQREVFRQSLESTLLRINFD